jgi:UDP-glucuronate 4-epimerase
LEALEAGGDGKLVQTLVQLNTKMAKILLTGAAGFIGLNAYKKLSQDHDVVALDNLSTFSNHQIKLSRLAHLVGNKAALWDDQSRLKNDNYTFYKTDIADKEALARIFAQHRFDAVINLAAMTGVRQSVSHPHIYEQSNIQGFTNLLEMCRIHGVKKIIYASSSSVYGGNTQIPFREDEAIDNLLNYYAVTKRMNELTAEKYSTLYEMQAIGLRFFTVYGPWTRPDMATYSFIKSILAATPITLFNHGNMERDFTYVDDIVESISQVLANMLASEATTHSIYNIGEGKPVNLREYLNIIEDKLQKKAIIQNAPMNKEEMISTFADCSKLFDFIGFKPTTTVEKGLEKTIDWFLNYQAQSKNG